MSIYIPSTLIQEHQAALSSCEEYSKLCQLIDGPSVDQVDPASLSGIHMGEPEPYGVNDLYDASEALQDGNLKKLMKLYFAESISDHEYTASVMDNTNESILIRLYAACQLMGANDQSTEEDKKIGKPWTINDQEIYNVCDKFLSLYNSAPAEVKQDDFISVERLICYCTKRRHEWYPLGEKTILDDIYNFTIQFEADNSNDLVKLRCEKEYHILAAWYRWHGDHVKCLEICAKIIDKPIYQYSYNPYRMFARSDRALVYLEAGENIKAAKELKKVIDDYSAMKQSIGFHSLHVSSFKEYRLFLVSILKAYDILVALTNRDFSIEMAALVRGQLGSTTEEKIKNLDIHNYRHQWSAFCEGLKTRMKYSGYIDYISL